jgi:hypothetical protein
MTELEEKSLALKVYELLRIGRSKGEIHPEKKIQGREIAARYNLKYGVEYTDVHVRVAIHHLRAEMGVPVGSDGDGYWLCLTEAEWSETADRLRARIKNQMAAIQKPSLTFGRLAQTVIKEFDAVQEAG